MVQRSVRRESSSVDISLNCVVGPWKRGRREWLGWSIEVKWFAMRIRENLGRLIDKVGA